MNGLLVFIMGRDCTNHGVTSGKTMAILTGIGCKVSCSSEKAPPLAIVEHEYLGRDIVNKDGEIKHVHAAPIIDGAPKSGMFGGQYIMTSDSRFPFESPVPVFDRFETPEEQRMFSI